MGRAIAAAVTLLILAGHNMATGQTPVYRCPGPPVIYTDALTPAEAKGKGCSQVEKAPTTICGIKNTKTGKIDNPCKNETFDWAALDAHFGTPPPPKQSAKLGPIDRWRYNSCIEDAAKAPTEAGVRVGLKLCRERFDQQPAP